MNFEYLADQILSANYLTKTELVKMLESNFSNFINDGILQKIDEFEQKKIVLMSEKSKLLEENTKVNQLLLDAKSLVGTPNQVSSRRS